MILHPSRCSSVVITFKPRPVTNVGPTKQVVGLGCVQVYASFIRTVKVTILYCLKFGSGQSYGAVHT